MVFGYYSGIEVFVFSGKPAAWFCSFGATNVSCYIFSAGAGICIAADAFGSLGLENLLKSFSLNITNQIIGGIIHSLIGLYVLCVLIWFLNRLDVFPIHQKETSHIYPYIANLAPKVVDVTGKVIPVIRDTFERFDELFGTHIKS